MKQDTSATVSPFQVILVCNFIIVRPTVIKLLLGYYDYHRDLLSSTSPFTLCHVTSGSGVPVALHVRMTSLPTCVVTSREMLTIVGGTVHTHTHTRRRHHITRIMMLSQRISCHSDPISLVQVQKNTRPARTRYK